MPRLALPIGVALALAACSAGSGPSSSQASSGGAYPGWPGSGSVVANSDFIPDLVNKEIAVETTRLLLGLRDRAGVSLAAPELATRMSLYDLAASTVTPVSSVAGTFRWLIPDTTGIYTVPAAFGRAGDWGIEVTGSVAGKADQTARVTFTVRGSTTTPAIGAAAIPSDTLTATDIAGLVAVSTDLHPDPVFYRLSVKDAIAAGRPFVLVFATPAFCTSRTCGPALDLVKQAAPAYAGRVNFIHVEPYRLKVSDGMAQLDVDVLGQRQPIRAVVEWGLPSEPFVFVVDAAGKVAAKFEGEAYPDELTAVLDKLLP